MFLIKCYKEGNGALNAGRSEKEGQKETERTVTETERQQGLTSRLQGKMLLVQSTHTSVLILNIGVLQVTRTLLFFAATANLYAQSTVCFPGTNLSLT